MFHEKHSCNGSASYQHRLHVTSTSILFYTFVIVLLRRALHFEFFHSKLLIHILTYYFNGGNVFVLFYYTKVLCYAYST